MPECLQIALMGLGSMSLVAHILGWGSLTVAVVIFAILSIPRNI